MHVPIVRGDPIDPGSRRLEDVLTVLAALERAGVRYAVFDDPDIASITAEDLGGEYPAVQYGRPDVDFRIDNVRRFGDAFRFEDLDVERVPAGHVTITVVTPETLYRMKRDTVRLRDRDDAQRLARAFGFGSGEDR